MDAAELSRQLRSGTEEVLTRRRAIVVLQLVASASMSIITLYQMGIIRHLPEPPLPLLDADAVDAAPEAYAILATPDAALGLASYGATTVLAAMAGPDRATTRPIIPLMMAAKILVDAFIGAKLTVDQWTKHRAFCFWCLIGALASVISVPLAIPETRSALRSVRKVSE